MHGLRVAVVVFVVGLFLYSCKKDENGATPDPPVDPEHPAEKLVYPRKEFRAVWMTTAWGLDWPKEDYNAERQKQQYLAYLDKFQALNINAIFFQVKAMGDAFYDSSYEPWSAVITGTRGMDPGYDILQFLIDEAHSRNIEFHAWLNPYRIATRAGKGTAYPALHPSVDPDWVVSHEKIQIYNPALPEVRQRLTDIVKELITQYDVDGIHFDDYFYPAASAAGQMESDRDDFEALGAGYSTIEDFRRGNVDKAIEAVHDVIVATRAEVVFSVSPAPNEDYNYSTVFADVAKWCKESWIDLVVPQLYQEIGNPYNDFTANLRWWVQHNEDVPVLIGHGFYKFGDPTMPPAFQSADELQRQFDLGYSNDKIVGNAQYSARYLLENRVGSVDKLAEIYAHPAVRPMLGRTAAPAPTPVSNIRIEGGQLKWDASGSVHSVVYYFADLEGKGSVLAVTKENSVTITDLGYYSVSTVNKDNLESEPSPLVELD